MPKPKAKRTTATKPREVVYTSLLPKDHERVVAFGAREEARCGIDPKISTLLRMLVRKGLDAVEAEATTTT